MTKVKLSILELGVQTIQSKNSSYTTVVPSAPIIITLIKFSFILLLNATIKQYLSIKLPFTADNIIFIPKSLNLKADKLKIIKEFKLHKKVRKDCKRLSLKEIAKA